MRFQPLAVALCLACAWYGPAAEAQAQTRGGDVFDSACAHCHGDDGRGGPLAPSILQRVAETDDAELAAFLRAGVPDRGMPPAPVADEQMSALVDYLRFLGSAAEADAGGEAGALPSAASGIESFRPLTEAMLQDPDDGDWLPSVRRRDGRPFSPLASVSPANVERLALAWARGLPSAQMGAPPVGAPPIVYAGVMFLAMPDASVAALDATTGDVLWQHRRAGDAAGEAVPQRIASLSLLGDVLYVAPERAMPFALDARTGTLRADAPARPPERSPAPQRNESMSAGTLATAGGLIFRGGSNRRYAAADAESGEVLWQTILGGPVRAGGISYAVDDRQYVAVVAGGAGPSGATGPSSARTGDGASSAAPAALYVFALPDVEDQN